jgi:hypothetical protein
MRILPHKQNTGGFFVAALHKNSELPWMAKKGGLSRKTIGEKKDAEGAEEKTDEAKEQVDDAKTEEEAKESPEEKPKKYVRGYAACVCP